LGAVEKVGASKFTKFLTHGSKMAHTSDHFQLMAKFLLLLPRWVLYALLALAAVVWLPRGAIASVFRKSGKPLIAEAVKNKGHHARVSAPWRRWRG
jgi:hypothetical protein